MTSMNLGSEKDRDLEITVLSAEERLEAIIEILARGTSALITNKTGETQGVVSVDLPRN